MIQASSNQHPALPAGSFLGGSKLANIIEIQDLERPELSLFARLTEPQLRHHREVRQGVLIAESARVVGHALDAGLRPLAFLMERRQLGGQGREFLDRCPETPIYVGERELLMGLTGYSLSRGILCALERPALLPPEQVLAVARRVAVLESITDSTNVGALFRSAAALGMDGVLLSPDCCDPLCRRAARVSMGAVFTVPWCFLERPWPERLFSSLERFGFSAAALALRPGSRSLEYPELSGEARLALLLGTEGTGLRQETIDGCRYCVMIPMHHQMDSLNVAAAGAVAFWQLGHRE